MLPKDGDTRQLKNWRPIAILPIMYKLFARLLYNRISPTLFNRQSEQQHAFTPDKRIEDALLQAEVVIEYALEFNVPVWLLSMDLRKAFDTVSHEQLLVSLGISRIRSIVYFITPKTIPKPKRSSQWK